MQRRSLKAELLARIKRDPREAHLKELAWAYVHGAPKGSADEAFYKAALVAKAKQEP